MAGKLILFFGVTGVDKRGAIKNLARWVEDHHNRPCPKVIDFEKEYLFNTKRGGNTPYHFLNCHQGLQREYWRGSWQAFRKDFFAQDHSDVDVFVSVHGCIIGGHYGVRAIIDPWDVAEWVEPEPTEGEKRKTRRPDRIVTLIDDVYDMWWRTEKRAQEDEWRGRPTIEQLIVGRRTELVVADQVAYRLPSPIPHLVLATSHPCETLSHWIYGDDPHIVYLSFPISAPRRLERQGDLDGVKEINDFLCEAYRRQHDQPNLVAVCPLGIDELPLVSRAKGAQEEMAEGVVAPPVAFDREGLRWNLNGFWTAADRLSRGGPKPGDRALIPLKQLLDASGLIDIDVGWRDYRLVEQSYPGFVAVYNPRFRDQDDVSRSVYQEIQFATSICPVLIYQNLDYDPDGVLAKLFPDTGQMSAGPGSRMVKIFNDLERFWEAFDRYLKQGG